MFCAVVLISSCAIDVNACTIQVVGLRDEFRRSKNIFIGEVVSVDMVPKNRLPRRLAENWNSLERITLRIKRSWKGEKNGTIEVVSNSVCECPMRSLIFERGKEFIIFADRDNFADACSMRNFDTAHERYKDNLGSDLRRLDKFWFRSWARIYPF